MDILVATRLGRSSVRHLRTRIETGTLSPGDQRRLLDQIEGAFDAVLGEAEAPRGAPGLTVIEGGRA